MCARVSVIFSMVATYHLLSLRHEASTFSPTRGTESEGEGGGSEAGDSA